VSGDQLLAWLDQRGVSIGEWRAYLDRLVARAREPAPAFGAVDEGEVEACVWAEAVCSGRLDRLGKELARMLAVAPGTPLDALDEAFARFCRDVATDELAAREIEANRLEWLRFTYEMADFDNEDAAREAALCVRTDGDSLAAAAARADVSLERRIDWQDEIERELATLFLTARAGDLVGPVPAGERFRLAVLQEKTPPSPEDEAVRRRAVTTVAERAVEREANERVVWIERL
jgi:hypothetical protein